jgi:hypothetical protein
MIVLRLIEQATGPKSAQPLYDPLKHFSPCGELSSHCKGCRDAQILNGAFTTAHDFIRN